PRGEPSVVQGDPYPGMGKLLVVGREIVPCLVNRLVELGTHLGQRVAQFEFEQRQLVRRRQFVDTDHVFRGVIRSQSVQRVIEAAVPGGASAACSARVMIASRGTPAALANAPRSAYGPISAFPLLEKFFVPSVMRVPSSF